VSATPDDLASTMPDFGYRSRSDQRDSRGNRQGRGDHGERRVLSAEAARRADRSQSIGDTIVQ